MLISKGTREDAIHALINTWLKDTRLYCGWCGKEFPFVPCCKKPLIFCASGVFRCHTCGKVFYPVYELCCEKPFISDNKGITQQFYREMQEIRQTRQNEYAATKKTRGQKNVMRWKLSFPPGLLQFLDISMQRLYHEKLFTKKYNSTWFAKKFGKYFQVPERI